MRNLLTFLAVWGVARLLVPAAFAQRPSSPNLEKTLRRCSQSRSSAVAGRPRKIHMVAEDGRGTCSATDAA